MLKIAGGVVLALILLVAVIAVIGAMLPVAHVATRSIRLPAPPESVYATIADFASHPSWRADVRQVEVTTGDAGQRRFTELSRNGSLTMEVESEQPPRRLVTRIVGQGLPFGGAWAYAIEPDGTGSRVTISEHGEVYNVIFRFVSRYVMGHTATLDAYLRSLGRNYGVAVTPVDAEPVRR